MVSLYTMQESLGMMLNNYSYNYRFPKLTFKKLLTIY